MADISVLNGVAKQLLYIAGDRASQLVAVWNTTWLEGRQFLLRYIPYEIRPLGKPQNIQMS